jgi:phage-related tail fiber protein
MPQDYYSLVTNVGLIKEAEAGQIGANTINLTEIAVGDGNGSYYEPDSATTSLVNELYRTNLTSAVLDANNPNQLIIEGVIPEEAGPFYIREVGIFDSDGDLFAIGKYPETFKSNYESGSGKRLYIRLIVAFVSIPNVQIVLSENINFDPNFEANLNIELANRLKISENLADLNDAQQARNNLNITNLTGAIMPFSFSLAPDGWLECNGSEISRTTYANLFSKIGTIYGDGDGVNTFNIPDLRGEFIRGWDSGKGIDSNRIFASLQVDEFKSHQHHTFFYSAVSDGWGSGGRLNQGRNYHLTYNKSSDFVGGNETRPRNIAMNYCIRY